MKKEIEKKKMDNIIDQLIKDNKLTTMGDINDLFSEMQGKIMQALIDGEMENHLGFKKGTHQDKSTLNRRNGISSNKRVKTDKGVVNIKMPRDRDGSFEPALIKKRQRVLTGLDDIVIPMYAKGLSLNDIKDMIKNIYKIDLSTEYISNLTASVSKEISIWQERPLKSCYPFMFVDCLYCNVKKDLVSVKTAIYVILGINILGEKEIIGIWFDESESATFWANILEEIKSRGVLEILFISMDGLKGLKEAIELIYPKTQTQRCVVHLVRNIYNILNKKEAASAIADFKRIYTASNKEKCKLEYNDFLDKYKGNKLLIKKIESNIDQIFQLFDYPLEIRKIIYTTNAIESVNSSLRKVTRGKGSFINSEALLKVLYLRVKDLELKWKGGTKNWNQILNQLVILFNDRILKYIKI